MLQQLINYIARENGRHCIGNKQEHSYLQTKELSDERKTAKDAPFIC